ncbi:5'-nucleotidase C-terminal domain-containing protein [Metamycoplasma auris]|uniref:2',3'-cyclic-nucleotide 2'-phosphodiesterase (5'-nucleotidase family) n=1 Tax=Metamycoplasma auris TaxID=51363 RepID=A0A2W7G6P8_9BACT|nr:5'-nucleotidase C-terminal domain-containing protein [Metamycoplasma auris]PZW01604.1 2',3'-cyclic-nucleotide 2'-phosphodiesterase (5'-nucleotidase family) [Metamycoplasma auris]
MRKKVFLAFGSALSTFSALPLIAIACGQPTEDRVKKAREAYDKAFKSFDEAINADIKTLKDKKSAISKEEDRDKKKKLIAEKDEWVKQRSPILIKLRKKLNEEYKNLRKAQKGFKTQLIKIVHTNDEHGRLEFDDGKYNNYSGMQGLAEILNRDFDRDLLLSAGDLIQGLPLSDSDKGLTISKVAKEMNYNAVAIGNHEFDYGLEHMFKIENETKGMPFLSANIVWNKKAVTDSIKTKDGKLAIENERVFTPYIIKELPSGIKVAIMGITTPDTQWTSNPKNSVHVTFLDPIETGKKIVKELKEKNVNFIVALTHLGVNRPDTRWDSREFTKNVEGVDLVLDGHSHTLVPVEDGKDEKGFLTQAECYTKYLSELDVIVDSKTGRVSEVKQHLWTIEYTELLDGKKNTIDSIKNLIGDLKSKFDAVNNKVVFSLPFDFKHTEQINIKPNNGKEIPIWKGRAQQTNLGSFAADAAAWEFIENNPKVDNKEVKFDKDNVIGLVNGGGLRQDTQKGDIKRADLLGISPFGNRVAAVKVKGKVLLEAMKHGAKKILSGGYAQYSSNVKAEIKFKEQKDSKFIYELNESSVKINDKSIDKSKDYFIVTNDFILIGGDGYKMLDYVKNPNKAKSVFEGGDILESYIKFGQLITKTNKEENEKNPFSKHTIDNYKDANPKNITVKHNK